MLDTLLKTTDQIAVAEIRTNGGTQMRAAINTATVTEYAEAMIAGSVFPPVDLYHDGEAYWLGDGFHRVAAAKEAQIVAIAATVHAGTRRDAILHSAAANADHGLRRTNADKRRSVITLLQDEEWAQWSDRKIAHKCKVSNRFVTTLRNELADAGISSPPTERKFERNGKTHTMQTADIGRPSVNGSQIEKQPQSVAESAVQPDTPPAPVKPTQRPAVQAEENGKKPVKPFGLGAGPDTQQAVWCSLRTWQELHRRAADILPHLTGSAGQELIAAIEWARIPEMEFGRTPAADDPEEFDINWEAEWTVLDQNEYRDLEKMGGWTIDDISRPLVAQRLAEEEDDAGLRKSLIKRYRELS